MKPHSMKWFALFGLLLFFGVAVAPSITANNILDENLVNVNVEIYGNIGTKQYTLELTYKEYQDLNNLFERFNSELENIRNTDEALIIIKNILKGNEKYSFLNEAIKSINIRNFLTKSPPKLSDETTNCIIIGQTDTTEFHSHATILLYNLQYSLGNLYWWAGENNRVILYNFLDNLFNYTQFMGYYFLSHFSFLFSIVYSDRVLVARSYRINLGFSRYEEDVGSIDYYSEGWVRTVGSGGSNAYEGKLLGDLEIDSITHGGGTIWDMPYPAASSFTGIKIREKSSGVVNFIGFARQVKIKEVL